jgi:hypothetical protein
VSFAVVSIFCCQFSFTYISDPDNQPVSSAMHTTAQIACWSVGAQAMVNAKVWDPSKAIDEVDVSLLGIGCNQKESRQSTFDGNIGDILVIFSVCFH